MASLEQIKEQLKSLGDTSKFLARRELKELPSILWENEVPNKIINGSYNTGNGILVATDRRLIFIDKGLIYGLRVEDFDYSKISSIEYSTGLMWGKLTIYASSNKAIIDHVEKSEVRAFADFVRNKVSAPSEKPKASESATKETIIDQLERLAALRDKGILTEQEFLDQKAKIINS